MLYVEAGNFVKSFFAVGAKFCLFCVFFWSSIRLETDLCGEAAHFPHGMGRGG
jgi:hypothetical protein